MATELQWIFITEKYSLVEFLDNAIVVARFNQNELMRELITIRGKLLESKNYESIIKILNLLTKLNEKIIDKKLEEVITKLIEQIYFLKNNRLEFNEKIEKLESKIEE